MTDIEIILTDLGEVTARDIAISEKSQGLKENTSVAIRGGQDAHDARKSHEYATKKDAVSNHNKPNYEYRKDNNLIESK